MPSLRVAFSGDNRSRRIKDVRTSGEIRGTLYLPPADYARADDDAHAEKDFSLEDIDVGNFNTNMCQCRNLGLMVHLIGLAVTRHADGTVTLDVGNSNLELFRAVLGLLPRYDAASTDWATGTIERVLVDRAIQVSKETRDHKRGVFPAFVAPGASEIEKLKGAVVPDYGSMKLLDDRLGGDGVRTRCLQFDYNAGFGTCLIKEPLAVNPLSWRADDAECDASSCGSLGTWPRPKETVLYDGLIGATVCRGGLLRVLRTNEAYMKHYREPTTAHARARAAI